MTVHHEGSAIPQNVAKRYPMTQLHILAELEAQKRRSEKLKPRKISSAENKKKDNQITSRESCEYMQ